MNKFIFAFLVSIFPLLGVAEIETKKTFDHYTVHYSVFTSTSLTPEIAALHQLKRAKDSAIINITLIDNNSEMGVFGQPAIVTGYAKNLMQQQKNLKFAEIKEPGSIYYIASHRFINEEVTHFEINIDPGKGEQPFLFKFTKTLYVNP